MGLTVTTVGGIVHGSFNIQGCLDHNTGHLAEDQAIDGEERDDPDFDPDPDFDSDLEEDAEEPQPSGAGGA